MAVKVPVTISDIAGTLSSGYTHIKIYRSLTESGTYREATTSTSRPQLQAGVTSYSFIDKGGTLEYWFKYSTYNSNTEVESSLSSAFRGEYYDTSFSPITYPTELDVSVDDRFAIERVRLLVGDYKEVVRDYISSQVGYDSISQDGYTHQLSNPPGWPLRVILDGTEYTTVDEPTVFDYQFVTFSGTTINTTSGVLDLWYHHFRFSDEEILHAFKSTPPPPGMSEDDVTFDLAVVCAAIELISNELRQFMSTSSSRIDIYEEVEIDPKGGIDSRLKDLERLNEMKDEMIEDLIASGLIRGVVID